MSLPAEIRQSGLSDAFRIGLNRLDPAQWLDVDADYARYIAEKRRLLSTARNEIYAAEAETEAAGDEVLALVVEHRGQSPADDNEPALIRAALLAQEDFVLMRRGDTGWRLAAALLCFPSAWTLREKFGRPINEIHAPVPGFGAGTRHAELIARMFDHLRPEMPVVRWNWSLFGDDRLHHPEPSHPTSRFGPDGKDVWLRLERQTLRRLPQSGDIVFAIRIYLDPLAALARYPEGAGIAADLARQLRALDNEQAAYKGLLADRDMLLARLSDITT